MYIRECKICGKEIVTTYSKKCLCSVECKAENQRRNTRKQNEKIKQIKRNQIYKQNKDSCGLADVAVMAKQAGMSYGQYVGLMMN